MRLSLTTAAAALLALVPPSCGALDASSLVQAPVRKHDQWPEEKKQKRIKQTKEELQREPATRKAINELIDMIPIPGMVKTMVLGDLTSQIMQARRDMLPEERFFMDKMVQFKGFRAKSMLGMELEIGNVLIDAGATHMGEAVKQMVQSQKTAAFVAQTFGGLATKIGETGFGTRTQQGVDLRGLASAVRSMAETKDFAEVEDPVPEGVTMVKDAVMNFKPAISQVADILDAKAKNPNEWASASQVASAAGIQADGNVTAIAEVLLWIADASKLGNDDVKLFHELVLTLGDVASSAKVDLPEPAKKLLNEATELSNGEKPDMKQLIPMMAVFYNESDLVRDAVKDSLPVIARIMMQGLESADVVKIFGRTQTVYALGQLLGSFNTTHPRKVARATAQLALEASENGESMSVTEALSDASILLRHVKGININDPTTNVSESIELGPVSVPLADFLDRTVSYIQEDKADLEHMLPSLAWLVNDASASGDLGSELEVLRSVLIDSFKQQMLFSCNVDGLREKMAGCADVPKPLTAADA